MAPFANPLRRLWARSQPSMPSISDPIASLDGVNEHTGAQQMHTTHQHQQINSAPSSEGLPPTNNQHQAVHGGHAPHHTDLQQDRQPTQQLDAYQNVQDQYQSHDFSQTMQDLESGAQLNDSARQLASRTATAQPSEVPRARDHVQPPHLSDIVGTANPKAQVKQEPVNEEHDGHDVFAEFTNEDYHEDDNGGSGDPQQGSYDSNSSAAQPPTATPLVKPEPESETQLPDAAVRSLDPAVLGSSEDHSTPACPVATQDTQDAQVASSIEHPATVPSGYIDADTHSNALMTHYSAEVPFESVDHNTASALQVFQAPVTPGASAQRFVEQYAQIPRQPVLTPQATSTAHIGYRSPSADSVIAPSSRNSKETDSPSTNLNLEANRPMLAQQFAQRRHLFDTVPLNAETVHANPRLLHGPLPTQQQEARSAPMPPADIFFGQPRDHLPPNGSTPHYAQHLYGAQGNLNLSRRDYMQYPACPPAPRIGRPYPDRMPSESTSHVAMPHPLSNDFALIQRYPVSASDNQHNATEAKEEDRPEASDDDEPLSSRVPRHRSMTASPTFSAAVIQPVRPSDTAGASKRAPKVDIPGAKQDSVIELSDDDSEAIEPFSWKLPDFEATYFPPTKEDGMPMSKVSIPGLVREEVALTEDHAEQEMQLFLNVFLPNQQALQAPDPEPAHAVLNFHTISVIIIETFEQYEIGDEMGRGYGFHGGNITGQVRRTSPAVADGEPVRMRSAKDADVDEIFFAVIDRWRAGLISGKETFKRVRGCQEFCDIALDVIHYVKEHGLLQPEPKKRKARSDKGVTRGPRGGAKEGETKKKVTAKRKADAVDGKPAVKKGTKAGKATELEPRKKAKVTTKKAKSKASNAGGVTVVNSKK